MRKFTLLLMSTAAFAAAGVLVSGTAASQAGGGPPVRYTMDAATMSGLGAFGSGGSGGGLGAAFGMMGGGAPKPVRTLELDHGSSSAASGAPQADHFMPQGAGLGASVRLLPLTRGSASGEAGFERPSGKLLLYWGCGERAGPGQPVVIDFAKLAQGQIPPGLLMSDIDLPDDWRITDSNSRTYTTWPNGKDDKEVSGTASLLGAHRIAANYSKEISFNLAEDFMPPLTAKAQANAAGGFGLSWGGLAKATGYYAWSLGAKDTRGGKPVEMVWWASSKQQAFGGPLWDWISPAGVRKLIAAGTVMPPEQRDCAIPAEVIKASGEQLMVNLQAYGPQADFAYPPRPADAKKPWNPEWIARVRFRSSTMLIPGMEMPDMSAADSRSNAQESEAPKKPKCKGLKGIAERAAGLCE
jgi:hypothetical protein